MVLWKENEMAGSGSEVFRDYLDRLLDDINKEAESERRGTAELHQLEQVVAIKRAALIKKRENLANLERKAALLLADKAVNN
jgi:hypothetical protein